MGLSHNFMDIFLLSYRLFWGVSFDSKQLEIVGIYKHEQNPTPLFYPE